MSSTPRDRRTCGRDGSVRAAAGGEAQVRWTPSKSSSGVRDVWRLHDLRNGLRVQKTQLDRWDTERSRFTSGDLAAGGAAVVGEVRVALEGEDDRALVAVRLVDRARGAPDELAGAGDAVVIRERPGEDEALLDLRVPVHGQPRARRPAQEAGHLALGRILVEHLDRDPLELGRLPVEIVGLDVGRCAGRGLHGHMMPADGAYFTRRFTMDPRHRGIIWIGACAPAACGSSSSATPVDAGAPDAGGITSLPVDETVAVAGLSAPVDVVRDTRGTPHIYGQTLNDVVRVEGYLMARDRFPQMEFIRRGVLGRLSEFAGSIVPSLLDRDKSAPVAG